MATSKKGESKKAAIKKISTQVSKKGNETTSEIMASLAAKTLSSPHSSDLERTLAAALLNQAPDKAKN